MRHPSFINLILLPLLLIGLAGCVPNDGLVLTQENLTDAKEEIAEGISTRIDDVVNAISDSAEAVKEELTGDENTSDDDTALSESEETVSPSDDDEIVIAAITEEKEEDIPPPSLDPKTFLGIGIEDLISRLGTEDYRRLDQDVLVLQFRLPSCVIDFVMSSDKQVSSFHSRHRISGRNYDDISCRIDLAARRDARQ